MLELSVERVRAVLPGRGWAVGELVGSSGRARIARRGERAVVVKLTEVAAAVARLGELGVTPPVVEAGDGYLVQEYVEGPNPDRGWFGGHLGVWSELVGRYLRDERLAELVAAAPGRERLTVAGAAGLFGMEPGEGWPAGCARSFAAWREQAGELAAFPVLPVHPDAHMANYVLAGGRPYLVDWDEVDLSDVVRDVGAQAWGFLPGRLWGEFFAGVGLRLTGELRAAVYWWSAFRNLRTALWVADGNFHAGLFERAVAGVDWVPG